MAADTSDDTPAKKKIFGVRYEPQISMGTLLIMGGAVAQTVLFWASIEHRLTQVEDSETHMAEMIAGRIQSRSAVDANISGDLAKIHDQLNDLGLRVYKLEIEPKKK